MVIRKNKLGNLDIKHNKELIKHYEIYLTKISNLMFHIEEEIINRANEVIVVLRAVENYLEIKSHFLNVFNNKIVTFEFLEEDNDVIIIDVFVY